MRTASATALLPVVSATLVADFFGFMGFRPLGLDAAAVLMTVRSWLPAHQRKGQCGITLWGTAGMGYGRQHSNNCLPPILCGRATGAGLPSRSRLRIGDLDQVPIRIADVHRPDRPGGPGPHHRPGDDRDLACAEMVDDLLER